MRNDDNKEGDDIVGKESDDDGEEGEEGNVRGEGDDDREEDNDDWEENDLDDGAPSSHRNQPLSKGDAGELLVLLLFGWGGDRQRPAHRRTKVYCAGKR